MTARSARATMTSRAPGMRRNVRVGERQLGGIEKAQRKRSEERAGRHSAIRMKHAFSCNAALSARREWEPRSRLTSLRARKRGRL